LRLRGLSYTNYKLFFMTENPNQENSGKNSGAEAICKYDSGEKIDAFLAEMEAKIAESNETTMYVMLSMNHMLRDSQFPKFLNDSNKQRISAIWDKISLSGLELNKPPIIFGAPEISSVAKNALDGNLDDGTEIISITLPPDKEEVKPKKETKSKVEEEEDYEDDDGDLPPEDDDDIS